MRQPALKVAFDNSLAATNQTGTGVYASQLIRELSTRQDIQLSVLSGWGSRPGGGMFVRKLRSMGRFAWNHVCLPLVVRRQHFDLLHAPAFTVPFGCPCPTVVTIHDLSFLLHPHHFSPGWRTYAASMLPRVLRSAGGIICVSESTKRDLLRFYPAADGKVHVVHNGLDHARFNTNAKLDCDWARSAGIHKPYVLHVGSLMERKNIPVLLRAVAQLRDTGKFHDLQLVLAGKEAPGLAGAETIDRTIEQCGLQDVVLKIGHVPDEQLAGLYAGASLLVMPSMYEGFGFPVLEAMATGTPVITTNVSSLPEVAGNAALLVAPGNEQALGESIHAVLVDGALRDDMRRKGLTQAQQFSWGRAAEETVAVYHSVAKR
jgi:glycosyltransferase involved in cell wall biosynthesis